MVMFLNRPGQIYWFLARRLYVAYIKSKQRHVIIRDEIIVGQLAHLAFSTAYVRYDLQIIALVSSSITSLKLSKYVHLFLGKVSLIRSISTQKHHFHIVAPLDFSFATW
jgi:D-alanyl-lipoteichoic acid acyltransferase DltB (MBOAT superfamily)